MATSCAYCHLRLLYVVKGLSLLIGSYSIENEVRLTAQSQLVLIAEEEASIALSDEGAVQIGAVLR